jgi:hypothetical protein
MHAPGILLEIKEDGATLARLDRAQARLGRAAAFGGKDPRSCSVG